MTEIKPSSTKELHFFYRGRHYELKAEDTSSRDDWVEGLKMLNKSMDSLEPSTPIILPNRGSADTSKRRSL